MASMGGRAVVLKFKLFVCKSKKHLIKQYGMNHDSYFHVAHEFMSLVGVRLNAFFEEFKFAFHINKPTTTHPQIITQII